jgi:transcriptional regulator with XRE-family HTH domain
MAELAKKAGLGYRTVRNIERNRVRRPHPTTLRKLSEALGVEPPELVRLMSEVPEDPKRRGGLLKEIRLASGVSQSELARRAGISQSYLSCLEYGKYEASPSTIQKLARALGVEPSELVGG